MTQPFYFITSVSTSKSENRAQEYIRNEVRDLERRTLTDVLDLEELERSLVSATCTAHELYPRTRQMFVRRGAVSPDVMSITVYAPTSCENHIVVKLVIAKIIGPWKGGLK